MAGKTVSIPKSLYEKIEERVKEAGFKSVSEYVTYVLKEVVSTEKEEEKEKEYTEEDEEKVKERLRALGYLG
jgi:Arc/MetJ-type ribon-helix-helix transcriptional regulator